MPKARPRKGIPFPLITARKLFFSDLSQNIFNKYINHRDWIPFTVPVTKF
jgi:hypothetical protein